MITRGILLKLSLPYESQKHGKLAHPEERKPPLFF